MKIKKGKLKLIVEVLSDVKVSLSQGRVRDEFIRSVSEHIETLNKDNNKILERFCKKDSKGNPITITTDKGINYSFSAPNMKKLQREVGLLMLEEVSVNVVPELGEIAESTNYSPKVGEADTIFEFIEDLNAKANPKKKVKSKKK